MVLDVRADTCPLCLAVHGQLDAYWACPPPPAGHGHKLGNPRDDGDFLTYRCPARGCTYTRSAPRKPKSPSKGDPMTTVQGRPSVPVSQMYDRAEHLRQLLPRTLDLDSFTGTAQAALYNSAALMAAAEKDPASFMIALTECAALGHYPDGKNYYLTPRGNKVLGVEGYRGIVQRMYNSGLVAGVTVREVCERDYFDFTEGSDEVPRHRFGNSEGATGADFFGPGGSINRGQMVGVYAYARLLTGHFTRVSLLSREDVLAARGAGGWKASDPYSPWNRMDGGDDHPEFQGRSMWWKTALKRAEPWTPTSSEDKRLSRPAQVQQEVTTGSAARPREIAPQSSAARALPTVPVPPPPPPAGNGKRQAITGGRQKPAQRRQQEPPQERDNVVAKALRAAIDQQFDRIGVPEEGDERENWVRKLNQDADGELTGDQLRFALATLGEKDGDDYAIPDLAALVELCNPGDAT